MADMQAIVPRRIGEAGVTLVEILVVLSIIAVTTGAAMLRLGIGDRRDQLTNAATVMALALTNASDAALAGGRDRIVEVGPDGYRTLTDSEVAEWHGFPGVDVSGVTGLAGTWRLSADGSTAPFLLRMTAEGDQVFVAFDGLRANVEGLP